jgi:hypothetical protein
MNVNTKIDRPNAEFNLQGSKEIGLQVQKNLA